MRKVFVLLMVIIILAGCGEQSSAPESVTKLEEEVSPVKKEPPAEIPKGILIDRIPENADVMFNSIRYVLSDIACLDKNYDLKENFINDPDCNRKIYAPGGVLASPRQLFVMDIESGEVVQITNTDCFIISGQVVDATTVMIHAACFDTDSDGMINEKDEIELYLLNLGLKTMDCLTCEYELNAVNNPDYSHVNSKIVFSAQKNNVFHNFLFTIDADKNLVQLTDDDDYMDFDCSWSEDGTRIVFSRVPMPLLSKPSQVWLMDSDGTNLEKVTDGGSNPGNEENHGPYPIGIDADPDLSPDNKKVVFSRLKTGKQNAPLGVFELVIIDVTTREEEVLDSQYANMIPEWKSGGILFVRQQSVDDYQSRPMDIKQSLYLYRDGGFMELEEFPYNVFPIGAYGGSWIE